MPGLITEDGANGAQEQPYTNGYESGADTNGHTNGNSAYQDYISSTKEINHDDWFIGSVDQGTTSSRFIIFNSWADPVAMHQIEFENLYPQSGYVFPTTRLIAESQLMNFFADGMTRARMNSLIQSRSVSRKPRKSLSL